MKYLLVIGLVALLLVLLLQRLSPYLRIAQEFVRTFRHFQQISATRVNPENRQPEKLVRCESCGTWVPIGRALSAGSADAFYCSADCLNAKKNESRRSKRANIN